MRITAGLNGSGTWKQRAASLAELSDEAERIVEPGTQVQPAAQRTKRDAVFSCGQLRAVKARIAQVSGRGLTFDEESAAFYDAVAPTHPES